MFDHSDRLSIVPKCSPTGQLIERMEREWAQCWDSVPAEFKEGVTPDNVQILKRFFMVGFAQGAKWRQQKGSN